MDLKEEKEIIEEARKNPEVFGKIYDEYYPKIFRYVLRRTAYLEIAQDITSEAFLKALNKLWQFRWRNISFSSWIYKIATNEINQYYRSGKYRPISLDEMQNKGFEPLSARDMQAEIIEAQEELKRHQVFLICQEKISRLGIKYQEVITLRFFEQKQIKEISEILGKPEGTIKSLLHRGMENLRILIKEKNTTQPFSRDIIVNSERSKKIFI